MPFLRRFGATSKNAPRDTVPDPDSIDIEPRDFMRVATSGAPMVDVRTPAEFHQLHLAGAHNVDIFDAHFLDGIEALGLDPEAPVYLYCRSGNRSGHAARLLRDRGYRLAFNVGGLDELVDEGAATGS